MEANDFENLLEKYNNGLCNPEEKAVVENWFLNWKELNGAPTEQQIERASKDVWNSLPGSRTNDNRNLQRIGIAASIILAIGISFLYIKTEPSHEKRLTPDIAPGGNRATITLSNGQQIVLSTGQKGVITNLSGLAYNDGSKISNADLTGIQTITTPKGGEYEIVLSDGTKVWLNAASTLLYPATFRERGSRKVELKGGEAYFQVVKDRKRPFVVSTGHQDVFVLGTHFNVNAYETGSIKTTLLEGSVRVQNNVHTSKTKSKILVPGEQSVNNAGAIEVRKVNANIELAWKKGKIQFVREDLRTVMNMISRWYDIDVFYQYYPIDGKFTGSISRSKNISEVLSLLETTGDVRFKIQGRQVLVMK